MLPIKISELGAINFLADEDLLPVVDTSDSTTKKVTAAQIRDFLLETLSPASVVVSQTTFGIEPAVGTSLAYAREDHTHGTPPDPMPDHLAAPDPHNGYLLANGSRALTGTLSAGTNRITALAAPLTTTDAVNKAYVDGKVQGLDWQESVKSWINDPPATPIAIGRYLVNTAPTGDWVGHANEIATWNGVAWGFQTPNDGWATWIEDADILRVFNGTAWVAFGSTSDHGALSGLLDDDHTQYFLADGTRDLGGPLTVLAIEAPDVSPENKGRIYFDTGSQKFRVSENSSDYVDLVTGGTVTSVGFDVGTTGFIVAAPNPITSSGSFLLEGVLAPGHGGTGLNFPGPLGHVLTSDGSGAWTSEAPATTSPDGDDTQIQFNDAGSFGATSALRWVANQVRVGADDAGFLGADAVFFSASALSPPQYAGNEVGIGYASVVGGSPAAYFKLGFTGDTSILQLQGPLGTSPGLSLSYTNNDIADPARALWIDADGAAVRIGNNSILDTTKVFLGSNTVSVRVSDAYDLPTADGAAGQVLTTDGAGTASWQTPATGTVTSVDVDGGDTGLTFSGGPVTSSGFITMAGTLDVDNGGTGATTLTGYVKGNGTSALTASESIPGSDVSGDISGNAANVTGTVAIANGGTGQTTAAAAFGALSPLTTKGDLLGYGPANARVPVGSNGQVLTADSTETLGVRWANPSIGTTTGSGADNQIAVWSGTTALEGDGNLTWDGAELGISGALTKIGGALSLTANAASDITVTVGRLDVSATASRLSVKGGGALELRTSDIDPAATPNLIEGYADLVFGSNDFYESYASDGMTLNSLTDAGQEWPGGVVGCLLVVELAGPNGAVVSGVIQTQVANTLTIESVFGAVDAVYRYRIYYPVNRVRNIQDPAYRHDAATKGYVDDYVTANTTTSPIGSVTEDGAIPLSAGTLLVDASAGEIILTLPAADVCSGRQFVIKKIDATPNKVIVGAYGYDDGDIPDQYIDGATFYELRNQYEAVKVQSNGTQFWII
jgi:hypothetical protein